MEDELVIQHQMGSLSQLWQNSKRRLQEKMKSLKRLLVWVESFSYNSEVFDTWLNGVELSFKSQEFITHPEKHRKRIRCVRSTFDLEIVK